MFHPHFLHTSFCTPDAPAEAMALISALVVQKEFHESRERRERSSFYETDDESDDPYEVKPEV